MEQLCALDAHAAASETTRLQCTYHSLQVDRRLRDQLITEAMPLCELAVNQLLRHAEGLAFLRDDLLGEAYLALCNAVERIPDDLQNCRAYLKKAISRAIDDFALEQEHLASARTLRRDAVKVDDDLDSSPIECETIGDAAFSIIDRRSEDAALSFELEDEVLNGCCTTDRQREVMRARLTGESDAKIAERLGISESTVRHDRHEVGERFLERNEEYRR